MDIFRRSIIHRKYVIITFRTFFKRGIALLMNTNYVAFSHFHGIAVNNIGLSILFENCFFRGSAA